MCAAVRTGFAHATGDIVMVQDADLEYSPDDYPVLLQPILDGQADVVLVTYPLGYGYNYTPDNALLDLDYVCCPSRSLRRMM